MDSAAGGRGSYPEQLATFERPAVSEVGTRAKRLRVTCSATTAPNGAALFSARSAANPRGVAPYPIFQDLHCEMCFRIRF